MKKLIFILLPLIVVISMFSVLSNKDITLYGLLNGLKNYNYYEFNIQQIYDAFNNIDLVGHWNNIQNIGDWFVALGSSIVDIFTPFISFLVFIVETLKFFVVNLYNVISFVFTYILGLTS